MNVCLYGGANPSKEEMDSLDLIKFIRPNTSPSFIWHTFTDDVTDIDDSIKYIEKFHQNNVPCECHFFTKGKHGLALADKNYAADSDGVDESLQQWFGLAINWLKNI